MTVVIRWARPEDAASMAAISRGCFTEPLRSALVTTQPGIAAFWETVLRMPRSFPGRHLVVAAIDGRVVGMAEFRTSAGVAHLSHICVTEAAQGQGIATRLITWFARGLESSTTFELNVFDENAAAIGLYRSLGFKAESAVDWILTPLPDEDGAAPPVLVVDNAHEQAAWFGTFGFCEVRGAREDAAPFHVGRVGQTVLRLFDPRDLEDESLLRALRALFPQTRTSLVRAEPGLLGTDRIPFSSSIRMVAGPLELTR
jgi:ribosomal protein S18 acetylase RimI-like enzyme